MGLRSWARSVFGTAEPESRDSYPYSLQAWINDVFGYNGSKYALTPAMGGRKPDQIPDDFEGLSAAQRANAVVFACMAVRLRVFTEVRFGFRGLNDHKISRPSDGRNPSSRELDVLRTPWPGATTGDLLGRMLQHTDLAGNSFVLRQPNRLRVLRPDWVTIIFGGDLDALDAEVIGYAYQPGGPRAQKPLQFLGVDQVAHFAPMPDPQSPWRGMSWLSSVIGDVQADSAATVTKGEYFANGALGPMVVTVNNPALNDPNTFNEWSKLWKEEHRATASQYDVLFFANGADAKVIGSDMTQADYRSVIGAGETRIAAAAGVPPIIVGLSEGLASATYSNYGQARRAFGDDWCRPTWRNVCGSLAQIIDAPSGSELWYDDSDVAFLREDAKDQADIQAVDAATIKSLIDSGFEPDEVVGAVAAGDFSKLIGKHTGLYSVQLQPPQPDGVPAEKQPANAAGKALAQMVQQHMNGNGGNLAQGAKV